MGRNTPETAPRPFPPVAFKKREPVLGVSFEPLLDAERAARLLEIHPKTLQRMARLGQVPAVRIGRYWRFRASDLDGWVKAGVNCHRYAYRPDTEDL